MSLQKLSGPPCPLVMKIPTFDICKWYSLKLTPVHVPLSPGQVLVIRPTIIGGLSIATFSLFSIMALAMTTAPVDSDHIIIPMVTAGVFGLLSGYPAASFLEESGEKLDF